MSTQSVAWHYYSTGLKELDHIIDQWSLTQDFYIAGFPHARLSLIRCASTAHMHWIESYIPYFVSYHTHQAQNSMHGNQSSQNILISDQSIRNNRSTKTIVTIRCMTPQQQISSIHNPSHHYPTDIVVPDWTSLNQSLLYLATHQCDHVIVDVCSSYGLQPSLPHVSWQYLLSKSIPYWQLLSLRYSMGLCVIDRSHDETLLDTLVNFFTLIVQDPFFKPEHPSMIIMPQQITPMLR